MSTLIHAISDTHGDHHNILIPKGDILIHAGDFSARGSIRDAFEFINWFEAQSHPYKILIPGNHDLALEADLAYWVSECKNRKITLLNDSGVEIEGVFIWGSAFTPRFRNWAFNEDRGECIRRHWDLIPKNTEIIITHGPPHRILDETREGKHVGCEDLREVVFNSQIKLHIFGHIHEHPGVEIQDGKTFLNVSALNQNYILRTPPIPYEIIRDSNGNYGVKAPAHDGLAKRAAT